MEKILAITLARGGSKRLPGKNIKELEGIPLIEYTIRAAKNSKKITRFLVSTDDQKIANIAKNAGAEVPFLRPSSLSNDQASPIDGCLHALKELKKREGYEPDIVVLLQPTSPFRTEKHIDEALHLLKQKNAESVISACPLEHELDTFRCINKEGKMSPIFPFTQDIDSNFSDRVRLNGAIYAIKTATLLQHQSFYTQNTYPYLMKAKESIDIDTAFDFEVATALFQNPHTKK